MASHVAAQPVRLGGELGGGYLEGKRRPLLAVAAGLRVVREPYLITVRGWYGHPFEAGRPDRIGAVTATLTFGVRHGSTTIRLGGGAGGMYERWFPINTLDYAPILRDRWSLALPVELVAEVQLRARLFGFVRGAALITLEGDDVAHPALVVGLGF